MRVSWWGRVLDNIFRWKLLSWLIFKIFFFHSWRSACFVLHDSSCLINPCLRAAPCDVGREGAAPLALPAWAKPHAAPQILPCRIWGILFLMSYFSRLLHSGGLASSRKPKITHHSPRTIRADRYHQEVPKFPRPLGAAALPC